MVLLRWEDKTADGKASSLVKVDEFHTYVRPTFRPTLSDFCTTLTGISQVSNLCVPYALMVTLPEVRRGWRTDLRRNDSAVQGMACKTLPSLPANRTQIATLHVVH